MSEDSYFRPEVPVTVPDDLRALQDDINAMWRDVMLVEHGYAPAWQTVRLGDGEGCQPPILHVVDKFGDRCECGEREWPAELQDEDET